MTAGCWAERVTIMPGVCEEAVGFAVQGSQVRGILSEPESAAVVGTVVLSHGWSGNRCGPSGLLTELARVLAERGYRVLRFDFRGRGESGGDGLQASLASMAEDLAAAARFCRERDGGGRMDYLGLCSGGNVVVGGLARLPAPRSLVLLSVYPFSDGDRFSRDMNRILHYLVIYWRKACAGETWKRLLRGEINLRMVGHVIFGSLRRRGANRRKESGAATEAEAEVRRAPGQMAKSAAQESRLSGGAAPQTHLQHLRPELPVLMFYGTADPDAEAAAGYFGGYARKRGLPVRIERIAGANHNFSSGAWRHQLAGQILVFLRR